VNEAELANNRKVIKYGGIMKIKVIVFSLLVLICVSLSTVAQTQRRSTIAIARTGNLNLEAGLVFKNGDVKPVARVEFLLLRNHPEDLIRTRKLHPIYESDVSQHKLYSGERMFKPTTFDEWTFRSAALAVKATFAPNFFQAAANALAGSTVASSITGFDGKTTFENVPVGDYFIFGRYQVDERAAMWGLPVTIKVGTNKMILDNHNEAK
jgi:hypothetical protein